MCTLQNMIFNLCYLCVYLCLPVCVYLCMYLCVYLYVYLCVYLCTPLICLMFNNILQTLVWAFFLIVKIINCFVMLIDGMSTSIVLNSLQLENQLFVTIIFLAIVAMIFKIKYYCYLIIALLACTSVFQILSAIYSNSSKYAAC